MSDRLRSEFMEELESPHRKPTDRAKTRHQRKNSLDRHTISMLPSYNHTLPTGHETGNFLSLDVGGSGVRVALVRLLGMDQEGEGKMEMVKARAFDIDEEVRRLSGTDFFDWLAEAVEKTVSDEEIRRYGGHDILSMGVAWSFPVECVPPSPNRLL